MAVLDRSFTRSCSPLNRHWMLKPWQLSRMRRHGWGNSALAFPNIVVSLAQLCRETFADIAANADVVDSLTQKSGRRIADMVSNEMNAKRNLAQGADCARNVPAQWWICNYIGGPLMPRRTPPLPFYIGLRSGLGAPRFGKKHLTHLATVVSMLRRFCDIYFALLGT